MLVQRAADIIQITKDLKDLKTHEALYVDLQKCAKNIIFSLSNLQNSIPYIFKDVQADYIRLNEIVIMDSEWFTNEKVLKAAINAIRLILRSAISSPEPYNKAHFDQKFLPVHNFCHSQLVEYYNSDKIQEYFNQFALSFLPRRTFLSNVQNDQDLDTVIEIGKRISSEK